MERLPLNCQGERRGEVTLALWGPNGARTEIIAQMDDPGDGLYRAFLLGERGARPRCTGSGKRAAERMPESVQPGRGGVGAVGPRGSKTVLPV